MIVVDLGCAAHGQWDSPHWLEEQFKPDVIYGFDPTCPLASSRCLGKTLVFVLGLAAWKYAGEIEFIPDGTASCLVVGGKPLLDETMWRAPEPSTKVLCFDFARWLHEMGERVTVKMDIEGAEFPLLEHMIFTDAIRWVDLLLIEWHCAEPEDRLWRDSLLGRLRCPVSDWGH
jgi:hypothetical protein